MATSLFSSFHGSSFRDPTPGSAVPGRTAEAPGGSTTIRGPKAAKAALFAPLLALLLSACGGSNTGTNLQDVGGFRVINAVSDAPQITFFIEGNNIGARAFGQASISTLIQEGNYDITAAVATLDNQSVTLLDDERAEVDVDEQTTLVLAGTMAAPVPIVIQTPNPDIATDFAELELLNTAPAGTLDLHLSAPDAPLGTPLASVAANSASAPVVVDAGTRRIRLTAAGSTDVLFDSGTFELPSGERLIIHARPYFGPGEAPLDVGVIDAVSTSSFPEAVLPVSLRIANAIADVPAADVSIDVDGELTTIESLAANSFSESVALNPGLAEISVTMETDPGTEFVTNSAQLQGGERRTLIAAGSFANSTTNGRLAVDPQRPIATSAQINFIHGSASAGRVDVYLLTDAQTTADTPIAVADLALLANSTLDVLANTYSLVFTPQGEQTPLADPLSITVENNQIYSILLTDAQSGGLPPQIIRGSDFE